MAELTDKEKIIKAVYEDKEQGFGSIKDTFKQANEKDKSIKLDDVKKYLDKQPFRQTQFTYKKFNSYVSPGPIFELEMDLVDFTDKAKENDGYRYGLVAIDNFTKFAWVVPMKQKDGISTREAFKEIIEKMGKKPKQMYSDQDGAFERKAFVKFLNESQIKHITSLTGAHTVERFNRTLKEKTQVRLDAMGLDRDKWVDQLKPILNKYNNTEHTTIKMSPNDAKKPQNEMTVKFNLELKAQKNRKYPELKKDSDVRVMIKKDNKTKGYWPKWSKKVYKIIFIKDGKDYMVNDVVDGKRKVYRRHELLKV